MFYTVEKVKRSAHIFANKCPIVMGFELKGCIFNAQIGCVEKSKLIFAEF